jgi:hypothetical protein
VPKPSDVDRVSTVYQPYKLPLLGWAPHAHHASCVQNLLTFKGPRSTFTAGDCFLQQLISASPRSPPRRPAQPQPLRPRSPRAPLPRHGCRAGAGTVHKVTPEGSLREERRGPSCPRGSGGGKADKRGRTGEPPLHQVPTPSGGRTQAQPWGCGSRQSCLPKKVLGRGRRRLGTEFPFSSPHCWRHTSASAPTSTSSPSSRAAALSGRRFMAPPSPLRELAARSRRRSGPCAPHCGRTSRLRAPASLSPAVLRTQPRALPNTARARVHGLKDPEDQPGARCGAGLSSR